MYTAVTNFENLPDSATLRLPAVCELFSISKSTVYRMVDAGKLTPIKLSERATGYRVKQLREVINGRATHD